MQEYFHNWELFHIFGLYPNDMKTVPMTFSFDGTFEGYLSAVYAALSDGLEVTDICTSDGAGTLLFSETRYIPTDRVKARCLWNALDQKGGANLRLVYFAFLSEREALLWPIYRYICLLFRNGDDESANALGMLREKLSPWAQRVEKEKRKLEATLQLRDGKGGVKWCRLQPAYNILPLLTRYCRSQLGASPWMLMDTKRQFGLRYMGARVEYFRLTGKPIKNEGTSGNAWKAERQAESLPRTLQPLQAAV